MPLTLKKAFMRYNDVWCNFHGCQNVGGTLTMQF